MAGLAARWPSLPPFPGTIRHRFPAIPFETKIFERQGF
jgi:hypothetical protein